MLRIHFSVVSYNITSHKNNQYSVSYKKNTVNKNYSVRITKQNKLIFVSADSIFGKKNHKDSLKIKRQVDY